MAKRKVRHTVVVFRDGKSITVSPGDDAFNFTADEIKEVEGAQPDAFLDAGEDADVDDTATGAKDGTDLGKTAKSDATSGGSGSAAKATSTKNKTNDNADDL